MTVRDETVKTERTRLPLRGAVRGLWILAGEKHPQATVGAKYAAILGRQKQSEIKARDDWKNSQSYFSFLILFF